MALFFSLLTVFFWGISFVATKIVVKGVPPITLALIRFSISFLVLALLSAFRSNGYLLSKREKKDALLAGFWGITSYFIFENMGVKFTTPSQASLLISTVPIFTMMISDLKRRKRSSLSLYLMSFVSLVGVAFIVLSKGLQFNNGMLGDIFILVAALSWGMYTLHIDNLEKADNILSTLEMTKWGLIFLVPFSLIEIFLDPPHLSYVLRPDFILWILFLGVLCSGLGYAMWNYGVKKLGSRTTGNLLYLIPLVSVIMDSVMLKNLPDFKVYVGGGLIMFGVIASEKLARKEDVKVLD